jgi:aspartate racemase
MHSHRSAAFHHASRLEGRIRMKTIGLLGGMTCESTVPYYRMINRCISDHLGREHSARLILYSVDFEEIAVLMREGQWDEVGRLLGEAAARLEGAGAAFLVLCSNTAHKVAPKIEAHVQVPLLHIVDVTAEAIAKRGFRKVGLIGTCFTMEQSFYRARLEKQHGLEVIVPAAHDRALVHNVIDEELGHGRLLATSRAAYLRIVDDLARQGAEGVILGCTEIPLLVQQQDSNVPLFDTTAIHAHAAALHALSAREPWYKKGNEVISVARGDRS